MGGRFDKFTLETSGGKMMEFGRAKYEVTSRGGKGFEAVKRANFATDCTFIFATDRHE